MANIAVAQPVNDLNPAPPNVLLLVDDSGDMQYRMQDTQYPKCEVNSDPNNQQSRWAVMTEALTGTLKNFGCTSGPNGTIFSNSCASAPNIATELLYTTVPISPATDWPTVPLLPANQAGPIVFEPCDGAGNCLTAAASLCNAGPGGWDQSADGVIDTFSQQIRFGLMTFDDQFEENIDEAPLPWVLWAPGSYQQTPNGGWSYWFTGAPPTGTTSGTGDWTTGSGFHVGKYNGSLYPALDWEVGSRNYNARPWKGRLMGFGSSNDPRVFGAENGRVKLAVIGNHPQWSALSPNALGSTINTSDKVIRAPIAGLLSDAYDFITQDTRSIAYPTSSDPPFLMGPLNDPLKSCRHTSVVLISGGLSNFDMRKPSDGWPCTGTGTIICDAGNACKCDGHANCQHEKCPKGQTCNAQCNGGSQCGDLNCDGATCLNVQCSGHSDCGVSCRDVVDLVGLINSPGDCDGFHCSGHSNCNIDCSMTAFGLLGATGSSCKNIHCDGDTQCLINCGVGNPNCSSTINCDGTLKDCTSAGFPGVFACNRSCPTPASHCGDGVCDNAIENCSTCSGDCPCAPPTGGSGDACDAKLGSCTDTTGPNKGECPYATAGSYAAALANPTGPKVPTYVIGLGQQSYDLKMSPPDNPVGGFHCPANWTVTNGGDDCVGSCATLLAGDFAKNYICDGSSENWTQSQNGGDDISPCCELWDVARGAGTQAYFPATSLEMKADLSKVLTLAAGGSTSRTQPVFAVRAPTIVQSYNPITPPNQSPSSYEGLSSFTPLATGASIWSGAFERRRLVCTGGATPQAEPIDSAQGDEYGDTLVKFRTSRQFFTALPNTGNVNDVGATMRRHDVPYASTFGFPDDLGADDNLTASAQTANATVGNGASPAASSNFANQINTTLTGSGLKAQDVLGIDWARDRDNCTQNLGAPDDPTNGPIVCAQKTLIWFGGDQNGLASDRVPGTVPGSKCQAPDICSPLGAFYHSTPVIVGPPVEALRDESYRRTFALDQADRPTVAYAASLDGQLHAFVLENNSQDTFQGSSNPYYNTNVPVTDGTANTELWSFVPPGVLPSIWPNFNANARLLDGGLTVSDIVPFRTAAEAEGFNTLVDKWKTILVGSSGLSTEGGFYYALDVTDPLTPQFLWQLRSDGGGNPLFGKGTPSSAIATVGVADPGGGVVDQLAVAILAGGTSAYNPAPPPTVAPRRCGCAAPSCAPCPDSTQPPYRSSIRDWGSSDPSRSVTIVELATGRIIKRFVGVGNGNTGAGDPPAIKERAQAGFDSPMTGTPIAFPNTPGTAASRIYVGDADGTMWRLDVSDPDPNKWKASIALDAYGSYSPTKTGQVAKAYAGQPINVPPILSTDPAENPVVMFATGDQEGFSIYSQGMVNYLISMTDKPAVSTGFTSSTDVVNEFDDGERVTGPLSLFNSNLYFATYVPNPPPPIGPLVTKNGALTTCDPGIARIWGINYLIDTANSSKPYGTGPADKSNGLDTSNNGAPNARLVDLDSFSVVFGVDINRVPSCVTSAQSFTDGWLAGKYQTQAAQSGSYELVAQTGQSTSAASKLGGEKLLTDSLEGATTNSMHVNIPPPPTTVHIESWTTITE